MLIKIYTRKQGQYRGKHRERLNRYTMAYMRNFYAVPTKRQPTYAPEEEPTTALI